VNLQITSHGRWLDSEVRSVIDEQGRYSLWVEPTPLWIALLQHTDVTFDPVAPDEDSGRAWLRIPYSARVDALLVRIVDLAANLRQGSPTFGQLPMEL
jgi:hypothetical protein